MANSKIVAGSMYVFAAIEACEFSRSHRPREHISSPVWNRAGDFGTWRSAGLGAARDLDIGGVAGGSEPEAGGGSRGEGRIRATWGWISVDRGSKATLPLTMPRRVVKSSAKDSAHRSWGRELRGGLSRLIGRTG